MMRTDSQRNRILARRLPTPDRRRLVVLTGARQTGKTTLAKRLYPGLRYVNLDAIEEREAVRLLRAGAWAGAVGPALLDEVQKEPSAFDKVKYAYDGHAMDFSVLLGSSRFLLMPRVRETLAGRCFVFELWPLMPCELRRAWGEGAEPPLLHALVESKGRVSRVLRDRSPVLLGAEEEAARSSVEHVATWGGMPELLRLDDAERREWLRSYRQTFLERDLGDLARMTDLLPFRTLERLAMLRSGALLSYADLARDAGIAPTTARRYVEYLRMSYQVILVPPFRRNLTSAVVKAPKLYWMDLGILRHGTGSQGPLTGSQFETLVVSEVVKYVDTAGLDAEVSFYRTRSGAEVDLVLRTPHGLLGIEVKGRDAAHRSDATMLAALAEAAGKEWLGGLVVTSGREIAEIDRERTLWTVPVHRLL